MKLLPLTSIRMWHSGTTRDTVGRRLTGFWRLGSESQVASRSLTWLHKAAACCTTYPTAYPGAQMVHPGSQHLLP